MKKILIILLTIVLFGCMDKTDERGFYIEGEKIGYHKETKTLYDKNGYDKDGYNEAGYNKDGYDKNGFNEKGYNKDGYDKDGINEKGYDKNNVFHKNLFFKKCLKTKADLKNTEFEFWASDEFLKTGYNLRNSKDKIHLPSKDEFEKTEDYKKRLKEFEEKEKKRKENEIKEIFEKMFVYEDFDPYIKYDADLEEWSTILSYGETRSEGINTKNEYSVDFVYPDEFDQSLKYKMNIEDAKKVKEIKIKYLISIIDSEITKGTIILGTITMKLGIPTIDCDEYYYDLTTAKVLGYQLLMDDKIIDEVFF